MKEKLEKDINYFLSEKLQTTHIQANKRKHCILYPDVSCKAIV